MGQNWNMLMCVAATRLKATKPQKQNKIIEQKGRIFLHHRRHFNYYILYYILLYKVLEKLKLRFTTP